MNDNTRERNSGSEKWIKQTRQRHPSALIPTCVSACCGIRIGRKNQLVALTAFSVLCAITFIADDLNVVKDLSAQNMA